MEIGPNLSATLFLDLGMFLEGVVSYNCSLQICFVGFQSGDLADEYLDLPENHLPDDFYVAAHFLHIKTKSW